MVSVKKNKRGLNLDVMMGEWLDFDPSVRQLTDTSLSQVEEYRYSNSIFKQWQVLLFQINCKVIIGSKLIASLAYPYAPLRLEIIV